MKSTLVMSNSVITKDMKKYPYSFSIPTFYSPSFSSQQGLFDSLSFLFLVKLVWKLKFTFSISPKKEIQNDEEYVFDPEEFISQSFTKVDWVYELQVCSCLNEHFNDVLGEKCEYNGKEESFVLFCVSFQ